MMESITFTTDLYKKRVRVLTNHWMTRVCAYPKDVMGTMCYGQESTDTLQPNLTVDNRDLLWPTYGPLQGAIYSNSSFCPDCVIHRRSYESLFCAITKSTCVQHAAVLPCNNQVDIFKMNHSV